MQAEEGQKFTDAQLRSLTELAQQVWRGPVWRDVRVYATQVSPKQPLRLRVLAQGPTYEGSAQPDSVQFLLFELRLDSGGERVSYEDVEAMLRARGGLPPPWVDVLAKKWKREEEDEARMSNGWTAGVRSSCALEMRRVAERGAVYV